MFQPGHGGGHTLFLFDFVIVHIQSIHNYGFRLDAIKTITHSQIKMTTAAFTIGSHGC
jgi:hypothetical protein